jgi:hypothetical protein
MEEKKQQAQQNDYFIDKDKYKYKDKDKEKEINSNSKKPKKKTYLNYIIKKMYNLSIKQQILIVSFLIYLCLFVILMGIKLKKINLIRREIVDNTYILVIGKDYLNDITRTLRNIHSISFDRNMTHFTKGVNFFSILTKELNRIKANPSDLSNPSNVNKENFIVNSSIENLNFKKQNNEKLIYSIDKKENSEFQKKNQKEKNGNFLLYPIFYSLIPNLIFDAKFNGLSLEKVYFVDSKFSNKDKGCQKDYNTKYFTYPKYEEHFKNFYLMDHKADPHSKCEENFKISEDKNFFWNFEEDLFTNSLSDNNINGNINKDFYSKKIFNQIQNKENDMKFSNLYTVIMSNVFKSKFDNQNNLIDRTTSVFSIGFNFLDNFSDKEISQNKKMNQLSILYFNDNLLKNYNNDMRIARNRSITEIPNYDIVNRNKIIFTVSPFIKNLYIHGFNTTKYFKEYDNDNNPIINTDDLFGKKYHHGVLNMGFEKDSMTFNVLSFLIEQIKSFPDNTCNDYNYKMKDFGVLDEQECFKDLCHFNECTGNEEIFNSSIFSEGFIKCECLPFFCNEKTMKLIEKTNQAFIDNNDKQFERDQKNNIKDKKIFEIIKRYNKFQKLNNSLGFFNTDYFGYLKKNNKTLKCTINYEKEKLIDSNEDISRKINKDSRYLLEISLSKMPFHSNGKFILSYFFNLNEFVYDLFLDYRKEIKNFNLILLIIYGILICFYSIIFFKRFFNLLDRLTEKMQRLTEPKILSKILNRNKFSEKKQEDQEKNLITSINRY